MKTKKKVKIKDINQNISKKYNKMVLAVKSIKKKYGSYTFESKMLKKEEAHKFLLK